MKYVIIPFISLGLVLSLAIGIKYDCEGPEMFPIYYGSPFVFKQKSLGSSLEYYYSISGLLLNVLIWSAMLFAINWGIQILIKKVPLRWLISFIYKLVIGILMVFTSFYIAFSIATKASGFDKVLNYWYWNMNKEAKDWGVTCKGKLIILEE